MENILKEIPKVELHCHLDGSVRAETMYELLAKDEKIGTKSFKEFQEMVRVKDDCKSLVEYLEKFNYPLKVMQGKPNIERITYELLEDLNTQNVKYVEIRFAPTLHMKEGLTFDEVVESVLKGMERAKKGFGILSNAVLICMRHESVNESIKVVEMGKKYLGKGVVAVDLAGNEGDFPPEIHKEAFDLAYEKGYHITVHAGETGIEENIIKSIELLHAQRIGHGIAAIKNSRIMEMVKKNHISLEMCPISNLQTKAVKYIEDYPIKTFMDKGLRVTINTDNATVSNTSLEREYGLLMDKLGFSMDEILKLIDNSIEAAFLPKGEKMSLRKTIKDELIKRGILQ